MTKLSVGIDRMNNMVRFGLMPGEPKKEGAVPTIAIECPDLQGNPDFNDDFWSFRMQIIADMLTGGLSIGWKVSLIDGVPPEA